MPQEKRHLESLEDEATHILEECRMVLPGIQALFGFQFIAVYNSSFHEQLTVVERILHLAATGFVGIAVAFVMTPAAYHSQVEPDSISRRFVRLATRVLAVAMFFLMLGTCVDFYIIARLILGSVMRSSLISLALGAILCSLWFILPWTQRRLDQASDRCDQ